MAGLTQHSGWSSSILAKKNENAIQGIQKSNTIKIRATVDLEDAGFGEKNYRLL